MKAASFLERFEVLALLCLLAVLLTGCGGASDKDTGKVAIGSKVPEFTLKSLDGTTVSSSSLAGNVVILTFWTTWCQACRGEIPDFKELEASSRAKVVAIALDEEGSKIVRPFVEHNSINYTVLLGNQDVFSRFEGFALPYTLVLDRKQEIVDVFRGPVTKERLQQDLRRIG